MVTSSIPDGPSFEKPAVPPPGPSPDAGVPPSNDAAVPPSLASDPKNCGKVGHDCLGGACAGGVCKPVKLSGDYRIDVGPVVDGSRVYIVGSAFSSTRKFEGVVSFPHNSTTASETPGDMYVSGSGAEPLGTDHAVVAGGYLYFNFRYSDTGVLRQGVARTALSNGHTEVFANTDVGTQHWNVAFQIDDTDVYWAEEAGLFRWPLAGGPNEQLVPPSPIGGVQRMAADKDALYLAGSMGVFRMDKKTKAFSKLDELDNLSSIAVDDTNVYAAEAGGIECTPSVRYPSRVWSIPKNGPSGAGVEIESGGIIDSVGGTGGRAYWFDLCSGAAQRSPSPGKIETLWTGTPDVVRGSIVAVNGIVYFRSGDELWRWVE